MQIAALTVEEVETMLDAYIIEQLRKEKEKEDVQQLPLTLELPNREEKEERREKRDEKKDCPENQVAVIRF